MESRLSKPGNMGRNNHDIDLSMANAMDLKLLKVFKAVVEAGGFTAAQGELKVGLAAISKQISDLEIRLGMHLCTRGREKFCLTEQGKVVYQASLELFMAFDNFRGRLGGVRDELLGDLNIAVIDGTLSDPNSPLIQALRDFQLRAPKVKVRLQVASLDDILRGIIDGRFAAAIAPAYEERSELKQSNLYEERLELYCSAGHPLFGANDAELTDEELCQHDFIEHSYAAHEGKSKYLQPRNIGAVATQVEAVGILLMTGLYLGFLPEHFAAPYVARGEMRAIQPHLLHLSTQFKLMVKQQAPRNMPLDAFVEILTLNINRQAIARPRAVAV